MIADGLFELIFDESLLARILGELNDPFPFAEPGTQLRGRINRVEDRVSHRLPPSLNFGEAFFTLCEAFPKRVDVRLGPLDPRQASRLALHSLGLSA